MLSHLYMDVNDAFACSKSTFLTRTNQVVENINTKMLHRLDGAVHTLYSVTKLPDENSTVHNLLSEEFLNSLTALGVPCPKDQGELPLYANAKHFSPELFDEQHQSHS